MNKIFKTMMLAAATVLGIASCENVPAPFIEPGQSDTEEVIDAKGSGTLADPFNVAGVINYVKELGADVESPGQVYIKGIVCSTEDISPQYKNATFKISDDVNSVKDAFTIYRAKGLNNQNIKSEDDVQVGDTVIVYGNVVNYRGNTPETVQGKAYIYWQKRGDKVLDGSGTDTPDTPSEPKGDGTLENPYNLAAIWALYENGNAEGTSVHVKGIISQVKSLDVSKWERAQYFISDDGTENGQFQIYNGYYLNGQPFTANDQIKVGDEVIVYGELSSYNGTPQIAQNSKIVSINGQTGGSETPEEGEEDTPTDDPSSTADWSQSMKNLYSDVVEGSVDAGTKTKDGVTITFEKNDGNNMPKYYFNNNEDFRAVRMYALNSMEIKSDKQISKIVLKCTSPSGDTTYNGNRTSTVSSGNIAWANDNQTVTISDINSSTFSLVNEHEKNSGGVQYRIHSMEIFYSK